MARLGRVERSRWMEGLVLTLERLEGIKRLAWATSTSAGRAPGKGCISPGGPPEEKGRAALRGW